MTSHQSRHPKAELPFVLDLHPPQEDQVHQPVLMHQVHPEDRYQHSVPSSKVFIMVRNLASILNVPHMFEPTPPRVKEHKPLVPVRPGLSLPGCPSLLVNLVLPREWEIIKCYVSFYSLSLIIIFSLLQYKPWNRGTPLLAFLFLREAPSDPQHPDIEKYCIRKNH